MKKGLIAMIAFILYTWIIIYSAYYNTIINASIETTDAGYIVTYMNTGDIHYYEKEDRP